MMDLKFNWVKRSKRGNAALDKNTYASVAVNKNGKNKDGTIRYSVVITFYKKAIEDFRLMYGDYMSIGFDKTAKLIALKRSTEDGSFKLSKLGNLLRFQLKYDSYPFLKHETIVLTKDNLFTQDGMFIFNLSSFDVKIK